MSDKSLQKYYSRLATEGIVKSLLWGCSIGFCVLTALGGVYWLLAWKSVWVCLLVWAAVTVGTTVALYYFKFKPTTKYIACRVDDLGLHERILTMAELEGDETYIAQRQRQDAVMALGTVSPELLKIGVSVRTVITAVATAMLGIGLVTVAFLGAAGIIPTGQQLLNPDGPNGPVTTYQVTYGVQEGEGTIQGNAQQKIAAGEKSQGVAAVASDGWVFLRWTDGGENPYREDIITNNVTYLAVFVEVPSGAIGDLNDNEPDDAPGNGGTTDDGKPDDDSEQGDEAKGKYEEINQVIDGKTYYGDLYGEAYEEAMDEIVSEDYDEDSKEIIGGYFDNIEKDTTEETEE